MRPVPLRLSGKRKKGGAIYLSDHSLTCHLPLRTPRAGWAAARQSHNSRPTPGPRANKAITKRPTECEREKTVARGRAKAGIDREVKRKRRCADTLFLLTQTLFFNAREAGRSHAAERTALIAEDAAWIPCLARDPNAHFIIRRNWHRYIYTERGTAEEFGGMLPGRSEAWFIEWKQHKQTTAKALGSTHTHTPTHTSK